MMRIAPYFHACRGRKMLDGLLICLFCLFTPISAKAISEDNDALPTGFAPAFGNKAAAAAKKVTGNVGEFFMDDHYKLQKWEKIKSQVGVQGIDGLYVQRYANGVIKRVLVSESKSGSSFLVETNHGTQMSHQWVQRKIQELENARKTILDKLQKTANSPDVVMQLNAELEALPSEKDIIALKRFTENPDAYRRRLFHSEVSEGALKITISDIAEVAGSIELKPVDGRSRIEKGREYLDAKETRVISLREPPVKGDDLRVYNMYFSTIEQELSAYMDPIAVRKTIETLKDHFKTKRISNTSEQYHFLRNEIEQYLEQAVKSADSTVAKKLARTCLIEFKLSSRIPSNVRATANAAMMAGLFSTAGHAWSVYEGNESLLEAAGKVGKDTTLAGSSMYVSEALIQRVNNSTVISAVSKGALGIGIATFVFDETNHVYSFARGEIDNDQFIEETAKSTAKALVSSTAAYGAVLIGVSPGGPIVMAVSIGSYLIADLTFAKYEEINARNAVTIKDVLWQLPLDIQKRATILNIKEATGETILDPTSMPGNKSVLDLESQGSRSTVLSPDSSDENYSVLSR